MRSWTTITMTVAPIAPPSFTRPFAVPNLLLNHCTGRLFDSVYIIDPPRPYRIPDTNNPARLFTAMPPTILLAPNSSVPINAAHRTPIIRERRIPNRVKATVNARPSEPTNDNVLADTFCSVVCDRLLWYIPHDPTQALTQNVWMAQAKTMVQP